MTRRILAMFVGLLLVAGTSTVLTPPAEARGVQLSLYNTGTRYVGQLVPMRGFMNYAGTRHDKTLLLQKFYKGKWYTVERKLNRANGGFRFQGHTYAKPTERYYRVVAKKHGKTIKVSKAILVRVKQRTTPTPPTPPGNARPVATDDTATAVNNTTTSIPVLANDTDANGDALAITRVGAPDHGTASIVSGAVSYTPTPGYVGLDRFDYAISDGKGGTDSAVVQVNVTAAPPAPGPTYTVKVRVKADAPNYIQESDETNNEATATVTITGDSVTNVVATDGVAAGTDLRYVTPQTKADADPVGPAVLPDLRIKRLTACGAGDRTHADQNNGKDCFFIAHTAPGTSADRVLLKFAAITLNAGMAPLEVRSTRTDGATEGINSWHGEAKQRIYHDSNSDGTYESNNYEDVTSPNLNFYWEHLAAGTDDHGHSHWHMQDFDAYSIDDQAGAVNEKHGFCFEDNTTITSPDPGPARYTQSLADDGETTCGFQQETTDHIIHGLSPAWGDTYPASLLDQGIDITAIIPPA